MDFPREPLDSVHRLYQSEESVKILGSLITHKLFMSLLVIQILLGMFIPLGILVLAKARGFGDELRKLLYFTAVILIQLGIFATRWNVVIGGQLFSKSFRGLMTYKMEVMGIEGLLAALALLALPFVILSVLIRLLPTKRMGEAAPS